MHSQSSTNEAHELQAELLVDILSTKKSLFVAGITEYELINILKKAPFRLFDEDALRDPFMLFKTHFVLFHALYQLKTHWIEQREGFLDIHALSIKLNLFNASDLMQSSADESTTVLDKPDLLAEYYLDWGNFEKTDRDTVDTLLDAFWKKMEQDDGSGYEQSDIEKAHLVLGVPKDSPVTLQQLKRIYKRTLQSAHPDKGGTQQEAQSVIQAYQILIRYYSFK